MINKIGIVLILAFICYGLFTLGDIKGTASFKGKLDSLDKVNDSLTALNILDDKKVEELKAQDSVLHYELEHQKTKIVVVKEQVAAKHKEIDTYNSSQVTTFFNQRYPADTVSNLIPLAKPVLVSTAKDLASFDGAKKEIIIKDSIISIQESRITLKDSTLFVNKEGRYKSIIGNKDQAIAEWSKQYDILNLNYKKLQVRSKFQKIGSYIIIGGLAYTLLAH